MDKPGQVIEAGWAWNDDTGDHPMPLGERIKQLRKEHSWSQGELAEQVNTDARQISRYENDRITPSLDMVIRLAEAFNVSLDYLVLDHAPRRPLHGPNHGLDQQLAELATLDDDDRNAITHIIDGLIARNRVKQALRDAG